MSIEQGGGMINRAYCYKEGELYEYWKLRKGRVKEENGINGSKMTWYGEYTILGDEWIENLEKEEENFRRM